MAKSKQQAREAFPNLPLAAGLMSIFFSRMMILDVMGSSLGCYPRYLFTITCDLNVTISSVVKCAITLLQTGQSMTICTT